MYLLQKREENAISLAVTTPKAKVVDYAYSSYLPVSPKRSIILLASVIVGLLIPFIIIYVRNLLDNKIRETSDITQVVKNIPVIGEIPKLEKSESEIIQANDRSVLAESFRMLRTNLQFMFVNSKASTGGKVIFVTSTIKGEGKTFCSINLALTLANTGAKVVLVGADIRNPQIHRYSHDERNHHKGVVEFLVHEETNVSQYVQQSELNKNLSLIYSGTIPPNPAELWMRDRSAQLFNQLRQEFDYIVVDTAPTLLVTDTFLINKYADVLLYVLRAGYTEKRLLEFPTSNIESGKLKNVAFILNNVMIDQIGYGNRYGYYYQDSKNSFWKRLRKSF
ncbi:MAG: polysaccharide biosynthesis tyrosine autokinase [Bacteroidetes bacterium]|nr:polysaccharide biosynthesis tyrosine autokinase [Bacteroidota bacterium]